VRDHDSGGTAASQALLQAQQQAGPVLGGDLLAQDASYFPFFERDTAGQRPLGFQPGHDGRRVDGDHVTLLGFHTHDGPAK